MRVPMTRPKKGGLLTLFSITLLGVSIQGCAQRVIFHQEEGFSKGDNCLFCHSANGENGVRDFTPIYNNPKSHHPVGMMYPLGSLSRPDFLQPDGYDGETIFFDNEGDGKLDDDDVRLFGTGDAVTVECASCHREHGGLSGSRPVTAGYYLRVPNEGSRLCNTCHLK